VFETLKIYHRNATITRHHAIIHDCHDGKISEFLARTFELELLTLLRRRVIVIDIYASITESETFRKNDTRRRVGRNLIRFTVPG